MSVGHDKEITNDVDDEENLVRQVLAENPAADVGVRDEWKHRVGWHRQEDTGPSNNNLKRRSNNLRGLKNLHHPNTEVDVPLFLPDKFFSPILCTMLQQLDVGQQALPQHEAASQLYSTFLLVLCCFCFLFGSLGLLRHNKKVRSS